MLSKADSAKMVEANTRISLALEGINENLKRINDQNILHLQSQTIEHKSMIDKLQELTAKYWWLIIALIVALLLVMGYKEVIKIMIPGG